jgi:hypothetical protein
MNNSTQLEVLQQYSTSDCLISVILYKNVSDNGLVVTRTRVVEDVTEDDWTLMKAFNWSYNIEWFLSSDPSGSRYYVLGKRDFNLDEIDKHLILSGIKKVLAEEILNEKHIE